MDLVAHDMTAASEFYADLFGWAVEKQDTEDGPPYAMFVMDGYAVAGIAEMTGAMCEEACPLCGIAIFT